MVSMHPSTELLMEYHAGCTSEGLALLIRTHLEYCPQCRSQLNQLDAVASNLLEQTSRQPVHTNQFNQLMARIDQQPTPSTTAPSVENEPPQVDEKTPEHADSSALAAIPAPLRRWCQAGFDAIDWKRRLPSLQEYPIANRPEGELSLFRIKPGGRVYRHDHSGQEYTLVVKGCFSDEDGVYHEGDFLVRTPDEQHEPTASRHTECICLALTCSPVQFTGTWSRLLNLLKKSPEAPSIS